MVDASDTVSGLALGLGLGHIPLKTNAIAYDHFTTITAPDILHYSTPPSTYTAG